MSNVLADYAPHLTAIFPGVVAQNFELELSEVSLELGGHFGVELCIAVDEFPEVEAAHFEQSEDFLESNVDAVVDKQHSLERTGADTAV